MRNLAGLFVVVIVVLCVVAWWVSSPVFNEPHVTPDAAFEILPLDTAVTLAKGQDGDIYLVVSASAADADAKEAVVVDINRHLDTVYRDTLEAFAELGYEGLARVGAGEKLTVPLETLSVPFHASYPHIAAGTNFSAHAEEVGLDGEPFLFPKLTEPTAWNATVRPATRLDYEVELCAVTLSQYAPDAPSDLGYVLCNDFTDRWTLLRDIDLDTPMGRSGFPDAKGGAGMLPVGPFLVIPHDGGTFYPGVVMTLGLNGKLRQRARGGLMIWSPEEIARRALDDCDSAYESVSGKHRLTSCESIAPGTLILTGTPAGVMFHFLNLWSPLAYLREGDEVAAFADHLGGLRSRIGQAE